MLVSMWAAELPPTSLVPIARPATIYGGRAVDAPGASEGAALKITAVRVRKVRGVMPTEGPFWEERLVRPIDVYPEFRAEQHLGEYGRQVGDRGLEIEAFFLTIETDDGVSGMSGPFREPCAHIVATQLRPVLLGKDPRASE